jgi:hypothetical protein
LIARNGLKAPIEAFLNQPGVDARVLPLFTELLRLQTGRADESNKQPQADKRSLLHFTGSHVHKAWSSNPQDRQTGC